MKVHLADRPTPEVMKDFRWLREMPRAFLMNWSIAFVGSDREVVCFFEDEKTLDSSSPSLKVMLQSPDPKAG